MKIEILEESGIRHDGHVYKYAETRAVENHVGAYFCAMGWAKDLDGTVPTGDRDTSAKQLNVDNLKITVIER